MQKYSDRFSELMKRILSNVSQRKFGKLVGVTQTYISNFADGLIPSKDVVFNIGKAAREIGYPVTDWELLSACEYVPETIEKAVAEMLEQMGASDEAKDVILECLVETLEEERKRNENSGNGSREQ